MSERAKIVHRSEGLPFRVGPTLIDTRIGSADSKHTFLAEHEIPRGFDGPPPHTHGAMDHLFYVLAGRVRFIADGVEYLADAGDVAFLPRGVPHTFGNAGDDTARVLEFNSPGGFDRYYAELARAFPPGTEVQPAIVRAIMARHDITPA